MISQARPSQKVDSPSEILADSLIKADVAASSVGNRKAEGNITAGITKMGTHTTVKG